jgi:hypothetical protein
MPDVDPIKSLWKAQDEETFTMSLAQVHARAEQFQRQVRLRNTGEYIAAGIVIFAFGAMALLEINTAVRIGAVMICLGVVYVCWRLSQLGRAARDADRAGAQSIAAFHRVELERQRAALRTVWRWYLAPVTPGVLVFLGGSTLMTAEPLAERLGSFAVSVGFVTVVFAVVIWLNAMAARRIERELHALRDPER